MKCKQSKTKQIEIMNRNLNSNIKRLLLRHEIEGNKLDGGILSDDEETGREKAERILNELPDYWGSKKNAYYHVDSGAQDKGDNSDEDEAVEEAREALALQKQRLLQTTAADFLGSESESDDAEVEKAQKPVQDTDYIERDFKMFTIDQLNEHISGVCPDFKSLSSELVAANAEYSSLHETLLKWNSQVKPLLGQLVEIGVLSAGRRDALLKVEEYLKLKRYVLAIFIPNVAFYLALVCSDYNKEDPKLRTVAAARERRQHPVTERISKLHSYLTRFETLVEGYSKGRKTKGKVKFAGMIKVFKELVKEGDSLKEALTNQSLNSPAEHYDKESDSSIADGDETTDISDEDDASDMPRDESEFVSLKNQKLRSMENLNAFDDSKQTSELDAIEKKRKSEKLRFHVSRIDKSLLQQQEVLKAQMSVSGDADVPYKSDKTGEELGLASKEQVLDREKRAEHFSDSDSDSESTRKRKLDSDDSDDDLQYYDKVALENAQKKETRRIERVKAHEESVSGDDDEYDENDMAESATDGKRDVTFNILKNKGLTAQKKKIDRNPRLKRRKKFETAMKKLSSTRRVVKDRSKLGAYRGEQTGIRTDLARSVKF